MFNAIRLKSFSKIKQYKNECLFLLAFFFIVLMLRIFNLSIPCLFHLITNLYCPGCGITRMFFSLLSLNFKESFFYNPWVFILLVFGLLYYIYAFICFIFNFEKRKVPNIVIYIILVLTLIYWVLRNIPYFSILAP